jgi:formyl-CoA transferase
MEDRPEGALAGLRVVDLTRVLGGPYCTQWLADHGADVIKVEPPQGDETRGWGPPFRGDAASYFIGVNRNKRALALDLSKPAGREVLLRLLEGADVLVENFRPGTLEKWGLGYEEVLAPRFPRLVHCRISGFGADGPLGGLPGYDAAIQACAGLMSVNGDPSTGPMRIGIPLVDLGTGLAAAIGILLALVERSRSGRGQFVDATLYDTAVALLHPQAANWFLSGEPPKLIGNAHPNISPYDKFPTASCEIFLAVGNDRQFQRLCALLEAPELASDPRFRTNADRNRNRLALREALEGLLLRHEGRELCDRLLREGIPAGPVLTVPEVLDHPHTRHRGMVAEVGDYRGTGIALKLSRTPGSVRRPPPRFSQDSRDILREAGYTDDEISKLVAEGVVPDRPRPLRD